MFKVWLCKFGFNRQGDGVGETYHLQRKCYAGNYLESLHDLIITIPEIIFEILKEVHEILLHVYSR